jgi:hypothetical protein
MNTRKIVSTRDPASVVAEDSIGLAEELLSCLIGEDVAEVPVG